MLGHVLIKRNGVSKHAVARVGGCCQNTAFSVMATGNARVRRSAYDGHIVQDIRDRRKVLRGRVIEPCVDRIQVRAMQPQGQTDANKAFWLGGSSRGGKSGNHGVEHRQGHGDSSSF